MRSLRRAPFLPLRARSRLLLARTLGSRERRNQNTPTIYTEMNWETTEKPSRIKARLSSKKTSRRFSFCGSERSGTIDSFRVKYARVCAFHWTLWNFPQEVFKTSLDRILFGVGRYFTLVHIPPGARALVRSFLLKTTKHGFILYFNGKTLTNCPKLHVTAALQSFPAFIVKEHIYCSPERHIFCCDRTRLQSQICQSMMKKRKLIWFSEGKHI